MIGLLTLYLVPASDRGFLALAAEQKKADYTLGVGGLLIAPFLEYAFALSSAIFAGVG